jgi:hypothetical protein
MEIFTVFSRAAPYLSITKFDLGAEPIIRMLTKTKPDEAVDMGLLAERRDCSEMSSEEVFVQQFAKLFARYRDALTLETVGQHGNEPHKMNDIPARSSSI